MPQQEKIVCSACKATVPKIRYCTNCGALLIGQDVIRFDDCLAKLNEIEILLSDFKSDRYDQLLLETKNKYDLLEQQIKVLIKGLEIHNENQLLDEKERKEKSEYFCLECGHISSEPMKFCSKCGSFVGKTLKDSLKQTQEFIVKTHSTLSDLYKMSQKTIARDKLTTLVKIDKMLKDLQKELNTIRQEVEKEPTKKVEPKRAEPTPVSKPITPKTEKQTTTDIRTKQKASTAQPKTIKREYQPTLWSKIEKNLMEYWFFYLATILLNVGLTLIIYYSVVGIASKAGQLAVIYSIGSVLALGGQLTIFLVKRNRKLKDDDTHKVKSENAQNKKAKSAEKDKPTLPLLEFATVFSLVGFIVVFVGGILGIASYQALNSSKELFFFLSVGVGLLAILLGVLNDSETIVTEGFTAIFVFLAIDLLWSEYPPILNGITSLIFFSLMIILATLISIFLDKWICLMAVLASVPGLFFVPRVIAQVGLEFIPLLLIPVMILLKIHFVSDEMPIPFRRGIATMSIILPTLSMIVIAILNFYNYYPEQPWGRFYPFEGFIFSVAIIAAGYYYPFIQEKQLDLKKNNQLTRMTSLIMSGILSIFIVTYYWEPVTSILFFLMFLAFGIVGTLKAVNEEVRIENIITSLICAEVQVLLLIIKLQPIRVIDTIIIFICTITFLILPLASIIFNKRLHNPPIFYAVWSILGTINCIITGFVNELDYWLFFTVLVIFITVEFITNLLGNIQSVPNWRLMSLIGMVLVFIVTITFGISRFLLAFEFVPYIIFSYILLATAPTFFDIRSKEGTINE